VVVFLADCCRSDRARYVLCLLNIQIASRLNVKPPLSCGFCTSPTAVEDAKIMMGVAAELPFNYRTRICSVRRGRSRINTIFPPGGLRLPPRVGAIHQKRIPSLPWGPSRAIFKRRFLKEGRCFRLLRCLSLTDAWVLFAFTRLVVLSHALKRRSLVANTGIAGELRSFGNLFN